MKELRAMLKNNNKRGCLHYIKPELVDVLVKRGLLPEIIKITTITLPPELEDANKEINPKYIFLRKIRKNPKKVQIHDLKTNKIVLYPSMYKAALTMDQNT